MRRLVLAAAVAIAPSAALAGGVTGGSGSGITMTQLNSGLATRVLSAGGPAGNTTVTLTTLPSAYTPAVNLGDVLNYPGMLYPKTASGNGSPGFACDGSIDSTQALQQTELAAEFRSGGNLVIGAGCNTGAKGGVTLTDKATLMTYYGSTLSSASGMYYPTATTKLGLAGIDGGSANAWWMALTGDLNDDSSNTTTAWEKGGLFINMTQHAFSLPKDGSGQTVAKDLSGIEVELGCDASDTNCRIYGYHTQVTVPNGADGTAYGGEFDVANNAANPYYYPGGPLSKTALHLDCVGSQICTAGVHFSGVGRFATDAVYDTSSLMPATAANYANNAGFAWQVYQASPLAHLAYADTSGNVFGQTLAAGTAKGTGSTLAQGYLAVGTPTDTSGAYLPSIYFNLPQGASGNAGAYLQLLSNTDLGLIVGSGKQVDFTSTGTAFASAISAPSAVIGGGTAQSGYALTTNGNNYVNGNSYVAGGITTAAINVYGNTTQQTGFSAHSVSRAISAAGTTLATATALTTQDNFVTAVASGSGVALPNAPVGAAVLVRNAGTNALAVYPNTSSDQIEATTAGTAATVNTGVTALFERDVASHWYRTQ